VKALRILGRPWACGVKHQVKLRCQPSAGVGHSAGHRAVTTFHTASSAHLRRATGQDGGKSRTRRCDGQPAGLTRMISDRRARSRARVQAPVVCGAGRFRPSLHQACLRSRRPAVRPLARIQTAPVPAATKAGHVPKVQDLTGRPPRAQHPAAEVSDGIRQRECVLQAGVSGSGPLSSTVRYDQRDWSRHTPHSGGGQVIYHP
jgi:hypothetical protein